MVKGAVHVVGDSTLQLYGTKGAGANIQYELSCLIDQDSRDKLVLRINAGATAAILLQDIKALPEATATTTLVIA